MGGANSGFLWEPSEACPSGTQDEFTAALLGDSAGLSGFRVPGEFGQQATEAPTCLTWGLLRQ